MENSTRVIIIFLLVTFVFVMGIFSLPPESRGTVGIMFSFFFAAAIFFIIIGYLRTV